MDEERFDEATRAYTSPSTRRSAVKTLLATLLGAAGVAEVAAAKKGKGKKASCQVNGEFPKPNLPCCSGCTDAKGRCAACKPGTTSTTTTAKPGTTSTTTTAKPGGICPADKAKKGWVSCAAGSDHMDKCCPPGSVCDLSPSGAVNCRKSKLANGSDKPKGKGKGGRKNRT